VTARPPAGRPQQGAGGYANQFARAPSIRTGGFSFGRTGSTLRPEVNEIDMSKPLHRPRKRPGRKTAPRKLTDDLSEGFAFPGVSVIQEGTQEYEEVHQNARKELHSIEVPCTTTHTPDAAIGRPSQHHSHARLTHRTTTTTARRRTTRSHR